MSAHRIERPASAFSVDRRGRQRRQRVTVESHLAWIRTLPSVIAAPGPVEAAHIRYADERYAKPRAGLQEKPDDKWVVPLAADLHRAQHSMNEREFWDEWAIDPVLVAAFLWAHSGNDEAGITIIRNARRLGK